MKNIMKLQNELTSKNMQIEEKAKYFSENVKVKMEALRETVDELEEMLPAEYWPMSEAPFPSIRIGLNPSPVLPPQEVKQPGSAADGAHRIFRSSFLRRLLLAPGEIFPLTLCNVFPPKSQRGQRIQTHR